MSPRGLTTESIKTIKNTNNINIFKLDTVVKPRDDSKLYFAIPN
ncbi:palindromic element RPE4 domain-containing protein [Rickettsia asembonensis]|nr:palindromic element RPE4 domain-containing protein [Rickettsia asembonensis]